MGNTSQRLNQAASNTGTWKIGRLGGLLGCLALPWLLTGCFAGTSTLAALLGDEPLSSDLEPRPRLARSQAADEKPAKPKLPDAPILPVGGTTISKPALPEPPSGFAPPPNFMLTPKIVIGVWVNGEPIFTEEYSHPLFLSLTGEQVAELNRLSPDQQREKLRGLQHKLREAIIDQEVLYQHAVGILEKGSPKTLKQLKDEAKADFEKQYRRLSENKAIRPDVIRDLKKLMHRKIERDSIAMKFMGSKIYQKIIHLVGPLEVKEYYDAHQNEFTRPETVKWQDVFLGINKDRPTVADAHRYAVALLARCHTPEDFEAMAARYDEGDSKSRGGEGYGSRRRYVEKGQVVQDIRPPEVEDSLFKLEEGQVEIVDISTGTHIIRLLKHDSGGLQPFEDKLQLQIRNKLRNEIAEREIRHLTRELRLRAVIEYAAEEK